MICAYTTIKKDVSLAETFDQNWNMLTYISKKSGPGLSLEVPLPFSHLRKYFDAGL